MKVMNPHEYSLRLLSKRAYSVTLVGADRDGFVAPATRVCPKLYVIMCVFRRS